MPAPGPVPPVSEEAHRVIVAALRRFLGTVGGALSPAPHCDPQEVAAAAARLGVVRHVDRWLRRVEDCDPWHGELRRRLRPILRRHLGAVMKVHEDAKLVTRALDIAGISHVPFKGPFLSADLYGDPLFRAASDVDVVLTRGGETLAPACKALEALGYRLPDVPRPVLEYRRSEKGQLTLVCPGRSPVDIHHAPYDDLPTTAFAEAAARAARAEEGEPRRLRFSGIDRLMLLAVHYWRNRTRQRIRWLVDYALVCRGPETFRGGWRSLLKTWRMSFYVAVTVEAVRHEFQAEPAVPVLRDLRETLGPKERDIGERIAREGPDGLPFGLVQKVHRLGLPWRDRLRACARFLWPHPGRIVEEAWRPGTRRSLFPVPRMQRLACAGRRLLAALRTR